MLIPCKIDGHDQKNGSNVCIDTLSHLWFALHHHITQRSQIHSLILDNSIWEFWHHITNFQHIPTLDRWTNENLKSKWHSMKSNHTTMTHTQNKNITFCWFKWFLKTPILVVQWALADRLDAGKALSESWIYEMVSNTVFKVTNRTRSVLNARLHKSLPQNQIAQVDEALTNDRESKNHMISAGTGSSSVA